MYVHEFALKDSGQNLYLWNIPQISGADTDCYVFVSSIVVYLKDFTATISLSSSYTYFLTPTRVTDSFKIIYLIGLFDRTL